MKIFNFLPDNASLWQAGQFSIFNSEKGQSRLPTLERSDSGQVLLIIVLVMVVSLTVGLAVVSRSIVSVRTSTEEENSQRAFSAAEAGIERALKSGGNVGLSVLESGRTQIKQATTNIIEGTVFLLNDGNPVDKDDGIDIWLVAHNSDGTPNYTSPWSGNLTIYWGLAGGTCNNIAALEIITISDNSGIPITNRYVYDPCQERRNENHFSSPNSVSYPLGRKTFNYSTPPLTITSGFVVRVIPLYISTTVGVVGTIAIPSQGKRVEAVGESGGTARKVSLFQGWRKLPSEFFQYAVFSP